MKTRADLLAQLEAEQAAGDPTWREADSAIDDAEQAVLFRRLIALVDRTLTGTNVVHLHHRSRRAA